MNSLHIPKPDQIYYYHYYYYYYHDYYKILDSDIAPIKR